MAKSDLHLVLWTIPKPLLHIRTHNTLHTNNQHSILHSFELTTPNATNVIEQAASLMEQDNRLAHYFGLFWHLRLLLGVFSYFWSKILRHIIAWRP